MCVRERRGGVQAKVEAAVEVPRKSVTHTVFCRIELLKMMMMMKFK